jgi:hypothetical protein
VIACYQRCQIKRQRFEAICRDAAEIAHRFHAPPRSTKSSAPDTK